MFDSICLGIIAFVVLYAFVRVCIDDWNESKWKRKRQDEFDFKRSFKKKKRKIGRIIFLILIFIISVIFFIKWFLLTLN